MSGIFNSILRQKDADSSTLQGRLLENLFQTSCAIETGDDYVEVIQSNSCFLFSTRIDLSPTNEMPSNTVDSYSLPSSILENFVIIRDYNKEKTIKKKLEVELETAKKREEILKSENVNLKAENEILKRNEEKQQKQFESIQSQKRRVESQGNHLERKSDNMGLLVEELLSITQQYNQVKNQ